MATTDRAAPPARTTWSLTANLPVADAPLSKLVPLHGLRVRVEEGYERLKDDRGWADSQVRSHRAIRRHWALVRCAFSFCWQAVLAEQPPAPQSQAAAAAVQAHLTLGLLTGSGAEGPRRAVRVLPERVDGGTPGSYLAGAYDLAKAGAYGTLYVNSATGAYLFVPDAAATSRYCASRASRSSAVTQP